MTVFSFFHNSLNGDRTYEADDFAEHTSAIIGDGVVEGLKVTYTSAYAYTIATGKAILMGRSVMNDAEIATSIATPVNGAIHSVVVRMDLAARQASIDTISGTVYQDDNAIKEIPLATILVGTNTLTITDKRVFAPLKSGKISLENSQIRYEDDIVNMAIMSFKDGSDNSGKGLAIGAGGTTIIGGGESAYDTLNTVELIPDAVNEKLILTSDYNVEIWTGMQDVKTNKTTGKRFLFSTNGDLNIGGNNVDLTTCTIRYTSSSKILEIFHWTGTVTTDVVQLAIGDILYQNTPWINLPLSGVTEYTTGTTPQYKRKGGVVYLKGAVKGITAVNKIIGTLPVNYRPRGTSHNYAMPTTGKGMARWAINTDGTIVLENTTDTATTIPATDWFPINTCFDAD